MTTSQTPTLLSVQVGRPQTMKRKGGTWTSAIFKSQVTGRLKLERTNLDGDQQTNLKHHGGPDKAVCCFPMEHYPYWRDEFGLGDAFVYGAFGENFTIEGLLEEAVCIGDTYEVGGARVQVSQARIPCVNLVHKWGRKEMPDRMMELGHTGYYLRVVQTGEVGAGDWLTLLERPQPEITVALLNRAMYQHEGSPELWRRLTTLPELAPSGRRALRYLLKMKPEPEDE
jgi:MOSC domain-containing protein YiiM